MNLHTEIHFEVEICERLATHGWLYADRDAVGYDGALAVLRQSAGDTGVQ